MRTENHPSPLSADQSRDASATMRGYSYQVLCSLLAWIGLQDGEELYLEGAEDFDTVTADGAVTAQVKDTVGSGNITLRSPDAVDAIGHYWQHAERNKGRRISYRLLTTAGVGLEKGDPLGKGIPGIQLWQRAKDIIDKSRQESDVTALRTFLANEERIAPAIKEFLRTASNEDVLIRLIRPIDWDTASDNSVAIEQRIKDRLVEHGEKRGLAAANSERTFDRLYREAWSIATRLKPGPLTHALFVRYFDDATNISLPIDGIAKLLQLIVPAAGGSALVTAISSPSELITQPPPLPPRFFRRALSQAKIGEIAKRGIVVIHGSTGTGKTLTAAQHALDTGQRWGWVDLRSKIPEETRHILQIVAALLEAGRGMPVVLDDLDTATDTRIFEAALVRVMIAQRERHVSLVITATQALPARLNQALGLVDDDTIQVEPFTRDEINAFLAVRGCPDDSARRLWAAFIEISTLGHPQLVHARIATLEASGFPEPDIAEITQTAPEILDVQAEARKMLAELDASSRAFVYRLSITVGGFSRKRLLEIAGMAPAIQEPGNALDRLIGPWVEAMAPDYFRVSPLARSAGQEVFGPDWAKGTHRLIARALLQDRTLNADEVSKILMHATLGEDGQALAALSSGLANAEQDVWRAIAEWADWFAIVGIAPGTRMPADGRGGLFLARFLQFRIAAAGSRKDVLPIIDRFEEEFPSNDSDEVVKFSRFLFLSQVFLRHETTLPIERVITWAEEFAKLSQELSSEIPEFQVPSPYPRLSGPNGNRDPALIASYALMQRIKARDELELLLDRLGSIEADIARSLLWAMSFDESTAGFFVDCIWLHEWKSATPDWPGLAVLLDSICKIARELDLPHLVVGTAVIAVRVKDENLEDSDGALTFVDSSLTEVRDNSALLDAKARVLARLGKDEEALELWHTALPKWRDEEGDVTLSHSYRLASVSAVRLGRWAEAAELLLDAANSATKSSQSNFRISLLVDAGFAYWKADNNPKALQYFAEGIGLLDGIPAAAETDEIFGIQKRVGHTIMWVSAMAVGRTIPPQFVAPAPAYCSSLDQAFPGGSPPTPIDYIIEHLVEYAEQVGEDSTVFNRYSERLLASSYVYVRLTHTAQALRHYVQSLELDGLVRAAIEQAHGLLIAQQQRDVGNITATLVAEDRPLLAAAHDELVCTTIVIALFALAARGNIENVPIARWREDAMGLNSSNRIIKLLNTVGELFVSHSLDAEKLISSAGDWIDSLVASLKLGSAEDTSPVRSLQSHGLWAFYLLRLSKDFPISDDLASLVSTQWERLSKRPFLLVSPRTSVPALETALASSLNGWAKVKAVLSAALEAVRLPSGDRTASVIEAMAIE